ncbi:hypothetical protein HS096_06705 [candidate division WWE3 bacterium]|uniref:Uncharacterized protein n=1 Tax=candidate division WWE3 bacterium TaxID=2053526 RepID=A0A928Y7B4_UNCKA|nr:hypothetical protein [candidate division WWE3 bacterium]
MPPEKLNLWLQQQGWEIPFQAEIGEATIGSVAVGDTKESSLDGPGYFSSHVTAVLYIDENGSLRILSDRQDGDAFYEFKCSFGLSGIVVECVIEVRRASLCRANVTLQAFDSPQALADGVLKLREECDALLAVVVLHQLACFAEQRYRAGSGVVTPQRSQPECEQYRIAKDSPSSMDSTAAACRNRRVSSFLVTTSSMNTGVPLKPNIVWISNITSTTSGCSGKSSPSLIVSRKHSNKKPASRPPAGPRISCSARHGN